MKENPLVSISVLNISIQCLLRNLHEWIRILRCYLLYSKEMKTQWVSYSLLFDLFVLSLTAPQLAWVLENSPVLTSVFESELEAQFTPSHSEYLSAAWPQYHSWFCNSPFKRLKYQSCLTAICIFTFMLSTCCCAHHIEFCNFTNVAFDCSTSGIIA